MRRSSSWAWVAGALLVGGCGAVDTSGFLNLSARPSASGAQADQAGGASCPPPETRCIQAGATCGRIVDECGTLECGTCPEGQSCGGGGTPLVCGSAPVGDTRGDARWATVTSCGDASLSGITPAGDGGLWVTGATGEGSLLKVDATGKLLWGTDDQKAGCGVAPQPSRYEDVALSPVAGELIAWGYCRSAGPCGSVVQAFSLDGKSCRTVERANDETSIGPFVFDEDGSSLRYFGSAVDSSITYRGADGRGWVLDSQTGKDLRPIGLQFSPFPTFDPRVHAIVIAWTEQDTRFDWAFIRGGSTVVLVLDAEMRLQRLTELPQLRINVWDTGVSDDGSFVIAGAFEGGVDDPGRSERVELSYGPALLKLGPSGEIEWLRRIPIDGRLSMAVDASGRVAAAGTERCAGRVEQYSPSGDLLWARTFTPARCADEAVIPDDVAYSGGEVIVSGTFRGTVDFEDGDGPSTCGEGAGFLLNLGR